MQIVNVDQCFFRLDLPDFQDIGIDYASPPVAGVVVQDLIQPFREPFAVVIQEIVDVGDVVDGQHLQVFQPVDADEEPVVGLLVDQAAVQRVLAEDAGVVDDGGAVIVVVEAEERVIAEGVAQAQAADDVPELREEVVGIVGPDDHLEVYGEEQGVHRRLKDHKTAVARADDFTRMK